MVALTFIPNPNNHPVINHLDGCKHNNLVDNLEWCGVLHNNHHALRTGLRIGQNGGMNKLSDEQVIEVFKLRNNGYKHSDIADVMGVSRPAISHALSRTTYKHVIVPLLSPEVKERK